MAFQAVSCEVCTFTDLTSAVIVYKRPCECIRQVVITQAPLEGAVSNACANYRSLFWLCNFKNGILADLICATFKVIVQVDTVYKPVFHKSGCAVFPHDFFLTVPHTTVKTFKRADFFFDIFHKITPHIAVLAFGYKQRRRSTFHLYFFRIGRDSNSLQGGALISAYSLL